MPIASSGSTNTLENLEHQSPWSPRWNNEVHTKGDPEEPLEMDTAYVESIPWHPHLDGQVSSTSCVYFSASAGFVCWPCYIGLFSPAVCISNTPSFSSLRPRRTGTALDTPDAIPVADVFWHVSFSFCFTFSILIA